MIIQIIIAAAGVAFSALFGYLAFISRKTNETKTDGETKGAIASDVGYIKAGVDDLKREQRETNINVSKISERITRCEESCKQAHKRIDEINL